MRSKFVAMWVGATLVCGVAQAQSSVQVYGVMDMGIGSFRDSGAAARSTQLASGKLTTSYLGFKGAEDLGAGKKLIFALESHLRLDAGQTGRNNADPYFSRNSYVGLQSKSAGTLIAGRYNTPLWLAALGTNPLGSSTGFSPGLRLLFGTTGKTGGDGVWNNSLAYQTPRMGGLQATLQHQFKEAGPGGNSGLLLDYQAGAALRLSAAYQVVRAPYASGKEQAFLLGGAYQAGWAKLYAQYAEVDEGDTGTASARTRDAIFQLGAHVPLKNTRGALIASYAKAKTAGALATERQFVTLGYEHQLSKRTLLYSMWMTDKFQRFARGNTLAAGIRHSL